MGAGRHEVVLVADHVLEGDDHTGEAARGLPVAEPFVQLQGLLAGFFFEHLNIDIEGPGGFDPVEVMFDQVGAGQRSGPEGLLDGG